MFYIGLYWENMKKNSHLISISCWILLKVLSDSLSKLFGGLYDTFPLPYEQTFSCEQPKALGPSCFSNI